MHCWTLDTSTLEQHLEILAEALPRQRGFQTCWPEQRHASGMVQRIPVVAEHLQTPTSWIFFYIVRNSQKWNSNKW